APSAAASVRLAHAVGACSGRPCPPLAGRPHPISSAPACAGPYPYTRKRPPKEPLLLRRIRRRPTLPGGLPPSTIGAGGLNFRVRNGNGCDSAAMATGNLGVLLSMMRVLDPRELHSEHGHDCPKPSAD